MINKYTETYKQLSDINIINRLKEIDNYDPDAQKAMLEEAKHRKLIKDESKEEIDLAIKNLLISDSQNKDFITTIKEYIPRRLTFNHYFFYFIAIVFSIIAFYVLINITNDPFVGSILILVLLSIAYLAYNQPNKIEKRKLKPFVSNKDGEKKWLIAGYVFSIAIVYIGLLIGLDFYISGKKDSNGVKIYEYNNRARKHGLNMIKISIIMFFVHLIYMISK